MRRLLLALSSLLAAPALSGCEKRSQGAVTWCPRSEGDELNDAPGGVEIRARLDVGVDRSGDRLTAVCSGGPGCSLARLGSRWERDWKAGSAIAITRVSRTSPEFERTGRVASKTLQRLARDPGSSTNSPKR